MERPYCGLPCRKTAVRQKHCTFTNAKFLNLKDLKGGIFSIPKKAENFT